MAPIEQTELLQLIKEAHDLLKVMREADVFREHAFESCDDEPSIHEEVKNLQSRLSDALPEGWTRPDGCEQS